MAKLVFDYPFMQKEYRIDRKKDKTEIGRLNSNDIIIPDMSLFKNMNRPSQAVVFKDLTKVSRVHAKLTCESGKWHIHDTGTKGLGSNYGTYINGLRLPPKKSAELQNRDKIKFGPIECVFVEDE